MLVLGGRDRVVGRIWGEKIRSGRCISGYVVLLGDGLRFVFWIEIKTFL